MSGSSHPGGTWWRMLIVIMSAGWTYGEKPAHQALQQEQRDNFILEMAQRIHGLGEDQIIFQRQLRSGRPSNMMKISIMSHSITGVVVDAQAQVNNARVEWAIQNAQEMARRGLFNAAADGLEHVKTDDLPDELKNRVKKLQLRYRYLVSDYAGVWDVLNKIKPTEEDALELICNRAALYLEVGEYEKAYALLNSIDTSAIRKAGLLATVYFNRACIHSLKGNAEKAVAYVYAAYRAHPQLMSLWLTDRHLDGVRQDERIQLLARQLRRERPVAYSVAPQARFNFQSAADRQRQNADHPRMNIRIW